MTVKQWDNALKRAAFMIFIFSELFLLSCPQNYDKLTTYLIIFIAYTLYCFYTLKIQGGGHK